MKGPPIMAGFFSAATWICGALTKDAITFTCAFAVYMAAVAGGIRYGHAYHPLTSGSAATRGSRYTFGLLIAATFAGRGRATACRGRPRRDRRAENPPAPALPDRRLRGAR